MIGYCTIKAYGTLYAVQFDERKEPAIGQWITAYLPSGELIQGFVTEGKNE